MAKKNLIIENTKLSSDEVKKTEMIKKEYQYHPKYKEKMSNEKNGQ